MANLPIGLPYEHQLACYPGTLDFEKRGAWNDLNPPSFQLVKFVWISPKNPFVCPKKGITPTFTFLFFWDGIGTQHILFDPEGVWILRAE